MDKRNNNISTKKIRQYRSNQGRTPKQMRSTYICFGISAIGLLLCFIWILITK